MSCCAQSMFYTGSITECQVAIVHSNGFTRVQDANIAEDQLVFDYHFDHLLNHFWNWMGMIFNVSGRCVPANIIGDGWKYVYRGRSRMGSLGAQAGSKTQIRHDIVTKRLRIETKSVWTRFMFNCVKSVTDLCMSCFIVMLSVCLAMSPPNSVLKARCNCIRARVNSREFLLLVTSCIHMLTIHSPCYNWCQEWDGNRSNHQSCSSAAEAGRTPWCDSGKTWHTNSQLRPEVQSKTSCFKKDISNYSSYYRKWLLDWGLSYSSKTTS